MTFRKMEAKTHIPVSIGGAGEGFWVQHHTKAQKRLYFLRKLRKAEMQNQILVSLYREATESILTGIMTNKHCLCTAQNRKYL